MTKHTLKKQDCLVIETGAVFSDRCSLFTDDGVDSPSLLWGTLRSHNKKQA